jgi:hypothetical protein
MGFDKIHNVSRIQLNVILMARFIMILICSQIIFSPCKLVIKQKLNQTLSLVKVTRYLTRNPNKIINIIIELSRTAEKLDITIKALARYCSYDKRKRPNFEQEMDVLFSLS